MFCHECGAEISDNSIFCESCGAKQETEEQGPVKANEMKSEQDVPMLFCINCGKKIPADSRFCPECNSPKEPENASNQIENKLINNSQVEQNNDVQMNYEQAQPHMRQQSVARQQPMWNMTPEEAKKVKKRNKIIGIVVGVALGICALIIILSTFIKPRINLNKYMTISSEGYNTVGHAVVEFNREQFEKDYGRRLIAKSASKSNSDGYENDMNTIFDEIEDSFATSSFLETCVDGHVDKSEGLSNGDVITYKWECNDNLAIEMFGYKLKYEDITYTVDGLTQAETFDPFEGITVVFEGVSPTGNARVEGESQNECAKDLNFELDKNSQLKNGDTVEVSVTSYYGDSPIDYCIENYGKIPSPLTKSFEVNNLESYIKSVKDISENSISEMQNKATEFYKDQIVSNWDGSETLKSFTCLGTYLLTLKDGTEDWDLNQNILYLVYKAQVEDYYSGEDEIYNKVNDIYWYVAYYNISAAPDGKTTINIDDYQTPGDRFDIDSGIEDGWWSSKAWSYNGYPTLNELYQTVVEDNKEQYDCEEAIDENAKVEEIKSAAKNSEEGIIFPNSSKELLTSKDVEVLSDKELQDAINELYARHGYKFKDDGIREFYEQFDWYKPTIKPADFSTSLLNEVENKNLELLKNERDSR